MSNVAENVKKYRPTKSGITELGPRDPAKTIMGDKKEHLHDTNDLNAINDNQGQADGQVNKEKSTLDQTKQSETHNIASGTDSGKTDTTSTETEFKICAACQTELSSTRAIATTLQCSFCEVSVCGGAQSLK